MNLIQTTTNHVFSSAISGFGLSFGRDIYRGFSKYKWIIIAIIFFVLCIFMVFTLGVWTSRNQKNSFYSVLTKIFSISLLPIFGAISSVCLVVIFGVPDYFLTDGSGQGEFSFLGISNSLREYHALVFGYIIHPIIDVLINYFPKDEIFFRGLQNTKSSYMFLTNFLVLGIFLIGLYIGYSQRRLRELAWKSEKHNHKFQKHHS